MIDRYRYSHFMLRSSQLNPQMLPAEVRGYINYSLMLGKNWETPIFNHLIKSTKSLKEDLPAEFAITNFKYFIIPEEGSIKIYYRENGSKRKLTVSVVGLLNQISEAAINAIFPEKAENYL